MDSAKPSTVSLRSIIEACVRLGQVDMVDITMPCSLVLIHMGDKPLTLSRSASQLSLVTWSTTAEPIRLLGRTVPFTSWLTSWLTAG